MSTLDIFFVMLVLLAILVAVTHLSRLVTAMKAGGVSLAAVDRELIELVDLKAHLLEDLRDTELDYQMSKIGEDEYRRRKRMLEPRTIAVIKELERRGVGRPSDAELDEEELETDLDDEDLDDEDLGDEDLGDEDPDAEERNNEN